MGPLRLAVRISGSHPEDRGFESRRGHQYKYLRACLGFYIGSLFETRTREAGTGANESRAGVYSEHGGVRVALVTIPQSSPNCICLHIISS